MFKSKWFLVVSLAVLVMAFAVTGCGPEDEAAAPAVEEVGVQYQGAQIGLVVPAYVEIDSIAELNDYADEFGPIVGIDPGAGIMAATEEAIEVYDLQLGMIEGSDAAMVAELDASIANEEWIVVTGWAPHWKFAAWDLKFLEDPELVYGGEEYIANMARQDLADDLPAVHEFLQNFSWGPEDIGAVMALNQESDDFLGNARTWIAENQDLVNSWIPEGFEGEGAEVEILMVEWECATASTYTVAAILEDAGYDVSVTAVDAGIMWSSVAAGDADLFVCAWLPGTHAAYIEEFGGSQ